MIAAGIIGFMNSQTPLGYIVLFYLLLLGALQAAVLVPFPAFWARINMKWVPFLHTYRGRGAFLILMGSLSTGTGVANVFIGIAIVAIGLFHIILACWYKDTLDPSEFKKHYLQEQQKQQQQPGHNVESQDHVVNLDDNQHLPSVYDNPQGQFY